MESIKTTYTVIKLRQSKNRTIPAILFLNPTNPRISESALRYLQMHLEQGKSQSFMRQTIKVIGSIYDYYNLSYKAATGSQRLFLNDFITELTRGQILSWKPLKRTALRYAIYMAKDYARWLSRNQDILTDPQELKWAKMMTSSYKFLESNHMGKMFETNVGFGLKKCSI